MLNVKRAWADLRQQGWGKRSWNQLQGVWGKRSGATINEDEENIVDEEGDQQQADKRSSGWGKLQGVWGKRSVANENEEDATEDEDGIEAEKRAWNQMTGMWGKRSSHQKLQVCIIIMPYSFPDKYIRSTFCMMTGNWDEDFGCVQTDKRN